MNPLISWRRSLGSLILLFYLMSHNISQVGGLNEQQCPRPGYEKLLAVTKIFKTIPIKDFQIFSIKPLSEIFYIRLKHQMKTVQ